MDAVFFEELLLPKPDYKLEIGMESVLRHGEQIALMITEIEKIFLKEKPNIVIIQGDTNTVLAGALSATKIPESNNMPRIKIAHIEAGLRSFDWKMPEEMNRVIVDHISDVLFVPTENERGILSLEGISDSKIFTVGNTIVDMIKQSLDLVEAKSSILRNLKLNKDGYILLTLHRQENVDSKENFSNIIDGVSRFANSVNLQVIFPIHPRTNKMLEKFNIGLPKIILKINPVGYFDFISLEENARLILTDSGGVQEESCILQVPCVTLRDNTERPETVVVGSNVIAGTIPANIMKSAQKMMTVKREWSNPFGDGKTAEKIIDILTT